MSNKPQPTDEQSHFAKALAASLDDSLQELDDMSLQRLKQARARAVQSARSRRKPAWIAISAAASIAALLLIPLFWQQSGGELLDSDVVATLDIPPSAQELDDLDMLLALEDTDA